LDNGRDFQGLPQLIFSSRGASEFAFSVDGPPRLGNFFRRPPTLQSTGGPAFFVLLPVSEPPPIFHALFRKTREVIFFFSFPPNPRDMCEPESPRFGLRWKIPEESMPSFFARSPFVGAWNGNNPPPPPGGGLGVPSRGSFTEFLFFDRLSGPCEALTIGASALDVRGLNCSHVSPFFAGCHSSLPIEVVGSLPALTFSTLPGFSEIRMGLGSSGSQTAAV